MTATNHVFTGVAIAVAIRQPALVLPLALLSHFVCDAIPHWDYGIKFPKRQKVIAADLILAVILAVAVAALHATFTVSPWVVLAAGFLAILPDAMWLPQILNGDPIPFNSNQPLYQIRRFHKWIQWSETPKGLYIEIYWFILIALFISARYWALRHST